MKVYSFDPDTDQPLTLSNLLSILSSLQEKFGNAVITMESQLLERHVPMVVGTIEISNITDVCSIEEWNISEFMSQDDRDQLAFNNKKKPVIHITAYKDFASQIIVG